MSTNGKHKLEKASHCEKEIKSLQKKVVSLTIDEQQQGEVKGAAQWAGTTLAKMQRDSWTSDKLPLHDTPRNTVLQGGIYGKCDRLCNTCSEL